MEMMKVAVNEFVRRQTKKTGKTYSDSLTFEEVAQDAEKQMANGHFKEGYRDGVRIVEGSAKLIHLWQVLQTNPIHWIQRNCCLAVRRFRYF
jgi:hypothetical protein